MNAVETILSRIRALEHDLETEFAKRREALSCRLERGKILFDREVVRRHRALRRDVMRYVLNARLLVLLTSPIIYSLIVPFFLLDAWVSLYQRICFPVYGIAQVRRRDYLILDRAKLAYLNVVEKLNCAYCSYVNGVIAYVREVASRTEQYWCPIKHSRPVLEVHRRYAHFEEFGDAERYQERLGQLRNALRAERPSASGN